MSERTKLIKKAVMAGVGASNNADRIKAALSDAMQDLVKVGRELFDELEDKGKVKTETVQNFLRNLQDEATKKTFDAEKKVASKMQVSTKKAAREFGLATRDDVDEILERLAALEEAANIHHEEDGDAEGKKRTTRSKKAQNNN